VIENFFLITKEGELLPHDWAKQSLEDGDFTTIKSVIGAQWEYNDNKICKIYPGVTVPQPLPSLDGVLVVESADKDKLKDNIVIYTEDGSERFRVSVPSVSEYSKIGEGYFYGADFEEDGSCTVYLNDGAVDYKVKLDIETGELSDFEQTRV